MPYVRGYYRRSAGGGGGALTAPARLDVAIYDASTGETVLRGWPRGAVQNLRFSTALPGGFMDAEFVIRRDTPRLGRIDAGQKVIVRNGHQVVWWGWVEDLKWTLRGDAQGLSVMCMGPWQQASQRLMDMSVSLMDGDEAVKAALLICCDRISWDFSHIDATGVDMGSQSGTFVKAADVIAAACALGNTSGQPMLFAVWEPGKKLEGTSSDNLVANPSFETSGDWTYTGASARSNAYDAYSGSYVAALAVLMASATVTTDAYMTVTGGLPVIVLAMYKLDTADGVSGSSSVAIKFYDSGSSLVGTTTLTAGTHYPTATTSWQQAGGITTAPATAVKAKIVITSTYTGSPNPYFLVDSVGLYAASSGTEQKPLPWLWARDLSTHDYLLYTKRVGVDLTETTRALANAVWAAYGDDSVTAVAEDATSQAAYRQRDAQIDASDMDATAAARYRDVYLARYKDPLTEPASLTVQRGAILTTHGAPVDLPRVRAGDRLKVMDGPYAGRIFMLTKTSWSDDGLQCTPEAGDDAPVLLAKAAKAETPKWKPWFKWW